MVRQWREAEYPGASVPSRELGGAFAVVRQGFAEVAKMDLIELVGSVYGFRNQ